MKCRKSIYDLTSTELNDFITAVQALKANGTWDEFVKVHSRAMNHSTLFPGESGTSRNAAHRGPAFLPWHRVFINKLEEALKAEVPGVTLPYWPWEEDAELADTTTATLWTDTYIGGTGSPVPDGPFAGWKTVEVTGFDVSGNPLFREGAGGDELERALGSYFFPTKAQWDDAIENYDTYDTSTTAPGGRPWSEDSTNSFRNRNEGWLTVASDRSGESTVLHNSIHRWVGGDMEPSTSPNDPVFFLHHCNVDRMWAKWQERRRAVTGASYDADFLPITGAPTGHNIDDPMFPWESEGATPRSVLDYSTAQDFIYDDVPIVDLENIGSSLVFEDVPEGETTVRAAVFSVKACLDVMFEVISGPTEDASSAPGTNFGTPLGTSVVLTPSSTNKGKAYIWISYMGTNDGDTGSGSVTIRGKLEKGGEVRWQREWTLSITANTIARPTVAVCLSLDQSNSMNFPAGTLGATRIQVLREAASRFVEVVQPNNGVGIVRFDHDAYPGIPVTQIGAGIFDPNRVAVLGAVQAHTPNPNGWTSIGDGVVLARTTLNPVVGYDHKAIIVFTDGLENRPLSIADVSAFIDNRTFAIGLGNETQVSTAALNALTNGTGGYLLLTGQLTASIDDYFRLTKYFLQILAGVTNNNIVTDPNGFIAPGMKLRIPFVLNEADIDCTAILLTDLPVVQFMIESPNGDVMDSAIAGELGQTFVIGTNMSYYRFTLPLALGGGAHTGVWHAVLTVDKRDFKKHLSRLFDIDPMAYQRAAAHGVRYSFTAQTYSNLKMEARLSQNSLQPGATLTLRANLTEYGLPVAQRTDVQAELRRPDDTSAELTLTEIEPGVFETSIVASIQGIYHFHLIASGVTLRGFGFTREQTLTGAVFQGGDNPLPTSGSDRRTRDEQLCDLLECLIGDESVLTYLEERGIKSESLAKCLDGFCKKRLAEVPEGVMEQLPQRAGSKTQETGRRRIATRTTTRKASKKGGASQRK